jgi:CRISPR/Cas system-associated exonuclease Cas4 (RecB family)
MIKAFKCDKLEKIIEATQIDECYNCSKVNTECNIIPEYIEWIKEQLNSEKNNELSVTKLLYCSRRTYFEKVIDYTVSIHELYENWRGTLIHKILQESKQEDCLLEQKFSRKYKDIEVVGIIDKFDIKNKILYDYKTITGKIDDDRTLRWGNPHLQHQIQLNLYKWLLEDKFEIRELIIVYIGADKIAKFKIDIRTPENKRKYTEIEKAFNRLEILSKCWNLGFKEAKEKNLIPSAEKDWICKYCRFVKECNEIK